MFEAYKIGIKLSLINGVSSGLSVISGNFQKAHKDAVALQGQLNKIKLLGMAGASVGAAGFMGLGMIAKAMKPAEDYAHQLNILNMAGLKQAEIAEVVGDSWKNTSKIMTTTVTSNMRDLLDLKNIMGDLGEARIALPIFTKMQAVMAASQEGKVREQSQGFAYSMAKAMDIIGAVRNPDQFLKESEMMSKAIIATQGRVSPEAFKSVFQYARQAKIQLSDEFKYEILPTLIQENATAQGAGGGSRGVGPMLAAMYRWTNQGLINKAVIPELRSLGLYRGAEVGGISTPGTTLKDPLYQNKLAAANPFKWVTDVVVPAIYKKYGNISDQEVVAKIARLTTGNQLAGAAMTEFFFKQKNFLRDQRIIKGTMSTDDAYSAAMSNDPVTARAVLKAQWDKVKLASTMSLVPVLVPALVKVAKAFDWLGNTLRNNQPIVKVFMWNLVGLFGAMAVGGTITTLVAGFRLLNFTMKALAISQGASRLSTVVSMLGKGGLAGAAVVAAGSLGFLIGTLLNKGINALVNKWTNGKNDSLGGLIYDWTHSQKDSIGWRGNTFVGIQRSSAIKNPYLMSDGRPDYITKPYDTVKPSSKKQVVQVNSTINLDGRKVGQAVTKHQSGEADRPQYGSSWTDFTMTPTPVGF